MTDPKRIADLHIRLSPELLEKIKSAAKKARRTMPDFIRITLEDAANV